jgi:hypothetical protein
MQAGTLDRQQMGLAVGQQMETDRQTEGSTERHPSLTVNAWGGRLGTEEGASYSNGDNAGGCCAGSGLPCSSSSYLILGI